MSDWAYYLLAVLSLSVAIYFAWLLSGFWLQSMKRAAVPFLLMLIPFYNFLGLKLDHNVILIPLWAITTYAFIKSFETRSIPWSVVTGVFCRRRDTSQILVDFVAVWTGDCRALKSSAPWIITAVPFGLFLPHLFWLEANRFPTLVSAQHRMSQSWPDVFEGITGASCSPQKA